MHCVCCDYNPFTTTEFHGSLTYDDGNKRRMYRDRRTNRYYCDDCFTAVEDTYNEFLEGDEDND